MKPVVLVLIGAMWPGNDSAGPNLSVKAMCRALADRYEFRLIARDRPFDGGAAMAGAGVWQAQEGFRIAYLPAARRIAPGLAKLMRETPHDLLVLNGYFDREFTIPALLARRFGGASRPPVIVSPRGEFSEGALGLKRGRKALYRFVARSLGLLDDVIIHVTSEAERDDVTRALPHARIVRIDNARPLFEAPSHAPRESGAPLRVTFIGRISRVKGLDIALRALAYVAAPVDFAIVGPVSDPVYWAECEALIAALPPHVRARPIGEIANEAVARELAARDLMLLPSLSENFGHAIFESLAAGTPVLIGDRTPWRGLEAKYAGFDLPTADPRGFATAIDHFAAFDSAETGRWRDGARALAEAHVGGSTARADMAALFDRLIAEGRT